MDLTLQSRNISRIKPWWVCPWEDGVVGYIRAYGAITAKMTAVRVPRSDGARLSERRITCSGPVHESVICTIRYCEISGVAEAKPR